MFDPDGSTKAAVDGTNDAKEKQVRDSLCMSPLLLISQSLLTSFQRHYFAYKEKFNVNDFQGLYHTHKISHNFPIPGTTLRKEQERIQFMKARGAVMDEKVKKITKNHEKLAKVKERKIRLATNLDFQSWVGDMIRRVGGVLESAQETVQGSPPKANPTAKKAGDRQRELSEGEKKAQEQKTKAALDAAGVGSEADDDR